MTEIMCFMKNKKSSGVLFIVSVVLLVVSGYVFFTQNELFGLAGTQWILGAIVFGVYAIYAGTCCDKCGTTNGQ